MGLSGIEAVVRRVSINNSPEPVEGKVVSIIVAMISACLLATLFCQYSHAAGSHSGRLLTAHAVMRFSSVKDWRILPWTMWRKKPPPPRTSNASARLTGFRSRGFDILLLVPVCVWDIHPSVRIRDRPQLRYVLCGHPFLPGGVRLDKGKLNLFLPQMTWTNNDLKASKCFNCYTQGEAFFIFYFIYLAMLTVDGEVHLSFYGRPGGK